MEHPVGDIHPEQAQKRKKARSLNETGLVLATSDLEPGPQDQALTFLFDAFS
jgi:hypothetical protein